MINNCSIAASCDSRLIPILITLLDILGSLLEREIKKVKDQTTKIKLKEVNKLILELNKRTTVKNNHLVDLLQYHSLLEELTGANG